MKTIGLRSHRKKKRKLYESQKATLDTFLQCGTITQKQYDKSLGDLTEKTGINMR